MARSNIDTNSLRTACLRLKKASTGDVKTQVTNNELNTVADMLNAAADELDHLRTLNDVLQSQAIQGRIQ